MTSSIIFKFIIKMSNIRYIFKFLKSRYSNCIISKCNLLLRTRRKILKLELENNFLKKCILNKVAALSIVSSVKKIKLRPGVNSEKIILNQKMCRNAELRRYLKKEFCKQNMWVHERLTEFDYARLNKYLVWLCSSFRKSEWNKHLQMINHLSVKRYGTRNVSAKRCVTNLSKYELNDDEKFVLSYGLNFSLPPRKIKMEEVLTEFEILTAQLQHQEPLSSSDYNKCKSTLSHLAYGYATSKIDCSEFPIDKSCFKTLKSLRNNKDIVISKQDKGNGIVVMDTSTYVDKMHEILDDTTKFELKGSYEKYDRTHLIETEIRKVLTRLKRSKQISEIEHQRILPTGSQIPRMYGLTKVHKTGNPLRPILSMVGSPQHKLAQWLAEVLDPVLKKYTTECIKDSFTFAEYIRSMEFDQSDFLCSFDIKSLFTCVPVKEVINICADALFRDGLNQSGLTEDGFRELMDISTTSVDFLFNENIYRQVDGVAMGSPLGPTLANIFVGCYEQKLFTDTARPSVYFRYVDDTFAIFSSSKDCLMFLDGLNRLHPALKFTYETECENCLPFLDVLVTKDVAENKYKTSIYRKPTFTGNYIRFESFCHKSRKISLIKTLTHRAKMICSPELLNTELDNIKTIFADNGYPDKLVNKIISNYFANAGKMVEPKKTPVYLKLPFIGRNSEKFSNQIKGCVNKCFPTTIVKVLFSSRPNFRGIHKDRLPTPAISNLIYKFSCYCGSSYVGKTRNTLLKRSKQHVPSCLLAYRIAVNEDKVDEFKKTRKWQSVQNAIVGSSIANHLFTNIDCLRHFDFNRFGVTARGRNKFHLDVLESVYISSTKPEICKQTEFCYRVLLF